MLVDVLFQWIGRRMNFARPLYTLSLTLSLIPYLRIRAVMANRHAMDPRFSLRAATPF